MEMVFAIIVALIISNIPAIILILIGYGIRQNKPKTAKILFIIATAYIIIGLGICGTLLISL
jgi:hypothetical protein